MVTLNGKTTNGHAKGTKRSIDEKLDQEPVKRTKLADKTDYTRWRILDEAGRQTWHYLKDDEEVEEWPQTTADKWFLGLPTVRHDPLQTPDIC